MRKYLWIIPALLLFAALGAPNVHADTCPGTDTCTDYTIGFTTADGSLLPTSGQFEYDSTADEFTSFTVAWDGSTYNLLSAANNPLNILPLPSCLTSSSGAPESLSLLLNCNTDPRSFWFAATSAACATGCFFEFADQSATGQGYFLGADSSAMDAVLEADGQWSVSVIATPEPGTAILMLIGVGILGLVVKMRKYLCQELRQAT